MIKVENSNGPIAVAMASSAELNPSNTGQDFSASLLILANYSNFYSVITVLVCFIITVVFILR